MMSFVVDLGRQRWSATLEMVLLHVDLAVRRPVAMPAGFARHIAHSSTLWWVAPVWGAMGVRR